MGKILNKFRSLENFASQYLRFHSCCKVVAYGVLDSSGVREVRVVEAQMGGQKHLPGRSRGDSEEEGSGCCCWMMDPPTGL